MSSYGSDHRDVELHGGRARRAPIAFIPPPTTSSPSRARRAHPGGTITRVYPPNFDPNDRTHRFQRQRSASNTPRPEDAAPAAPRQSASHPHHEPRRHRLADGGSHRAVQDDPFPLGLPPHLDGSAGDDDDDAHLAADPLDGPWPADGPTDHAHGGYDSDDGWYDGREHEQQAPRASTAQRVATTNGTAAVSTGAALDLGMAAPGSARDGGPAGGRRPAAHGSMAADFEAGAPVVYVNDNPLIGYDAYAMQRRMEDEQQPAQQSVPEEEELRLAVYEAERQASAAEAAVRREEAAWRRAEAESRMRELQARRRTVHQPRGDADIVAATPMTADGFGRASIGKQSARHDAFAAAGRVERRRSALVAETEPGTQQLGSASARLVIPEGWGEDEPMAFEDDNNNAGRVGRAGSRLGSGIGRQVQVRGSWDVASHSGRGRSASSRGRIVRGSNSVNGGRGVHAPKQLEPSVTKIATAFQTVRRPISGLAAQPVRNNTAPGPAPVQAAGAQRRGPARHELGEHCGAAEGVSAGWGRRRGSWPRGWGPLGWPARCRAGWRCQQRPWRCRRARSRAHAAGWAPPAGRHGGGRQADRQRVCGRQKANSTGRTLTGGYAEHEPRSDSEAAAGVAHLESHAEPVVMMDTVLSGLTCVVSGVTSGYQELLLAQRVPPCSPAFVRISDGHIQAIIEGRSLQVLAWTRKGPHCN